ncbi:cold-regulated protein 27-like [Salvia miltiorrhiza]|uniref:cold-regulated protein 27-like n=1 Tax=Salvia miltiorrhiza TaxID=226208 RepID=UPI0025AD15BC|nr:cold-regulated protein 27-like [Salvia miltiorrhiza]XP_057783039.1 cold-regulated protein 27-like [Salvia miltiorrhiza]
MWTDEKHNLFLEHLEVSFVKQLHQSISLLDQCSYQDKGDKSITQIDQINARDTSKQLAARLHGCLKKIKCNRGYPISHVSIDSIGHIESPRVYRSKRIGMKRPAASARTPGHLTLCNAENVGKVVKPHGSDTCSHQFCASTTNHCDSHDSEKEGTGQNFVDEDNESNSDTESRVKRLKTVSPD